VLSEPPTDRTPELAPPPQGTHGLFVSKAVTCVVIGTHAGRVFRAVVCT
jgi:hypothetical protein